MRAARSLSSSFCVIAVAIATFGTGDAALGATDAGSKLESVRLPRRPVDQRLRLTGLMGFSTSYARYDYSTSVTMADGQVVKYAGWRRASGVSTAATMELRLPQALRRITIGSEIGVGCLSVFDKRSAVPDGVSPPFSRVNLDQAIAASMQSDSGVKPAANLLLSPYIEHDLGVLDKDLSRLRVGYEYRTQLPSNVKGTFDSGVGGSLATYAVTYKQAMHMVRVVADILHGDKDTGVGTTIQVGVRLGQDGSFTAFVNMGVFRNLGRYK